MDVSPVKGFSQLYDSINGEIMNGTGGGQLNPLVITILIVVLFFYLIVFNSLGAYSSPEQVQGTSINVMEYMLWGMMIFLILINGLQYFFEIDIKTAVKNLWTTPEVDVEIKGVNVDDPEKEEEKPTHQHIHKPEKEVFHIRRNIYNYDDAKAVCKAHGGKLADYSQIETAYNNGAEWCGYGWTEGQMGLFPTQKETWNKMQKNGKCEDGSNWDCGRPGVNGGYFANPNLKLGVNCWGVKRIASDGETKRLNKHQLGPKSKDECKFDEKVDEYKRRIQDFRMSSWNKDVWKAPEVEHAYNEGDIIEPEKLKEREFSHVHKSHKHSKPMPA